MVECWELFWPRFAKLKCWGGSRLSPDTLHYKKWISANIMIAATASGYNFLRKIIPFPSSQTVLNELKCMSSKPGIHSYNAAAITVNLNPTDPRDKIWLFLYEMSLKKGFDFHQPFTSVVGFCDDGEKQDIGFISLMCHGSRFDEEMEILFRVLFYRKCNCSAGRIFDWCYNRGHWHGRGSRIQGTCWGFRRNRALIYSAHSSKWVQTLHVPILLSINLNIWYSVTLVIYWNLQEIFCSINLWRYPAMNLRLNGNIFKTC